MDARSDLDRELIKLEDLNDYTVRLDKLDPVQSTAGMGSALEFFKSDALANIGPYPTMTQLVSLAAGDSRVPVNPTTEIMPWTEQLPQWQQKEPPRRYIADALVAYAKKSAAIGDLPAEADVNVNYEFELRSGSAQMDKNAEWRR